MGEFPHRKQNRLSGDLYRMPGAYFITICTHDRAHIFWREEISVDSQHPPLSEMGQIAEDEIQTIAEGYGSSLRLEKYVVMPNHVHLLLLIQNSPDRACPDIRYVVRLFKRKVTQCAGSPVWQKGFYDRIVRDDREFRDIWKYIDENPLKWAQDKYYSDENYYSPPSNV